MLYLLLNLSVTEYEEMPKNWINNYFSNRSQYVYNIEVTSEILPITFDVPHGSILLHLLFILYINDRAHISKAMDLILYADVTNVFRQNIY